MSAEYVLQPERIAVIEAIRQRFRGDSAATQRDRMLTILQQVSPTAVIEPPMFGILEQQYNLLTLST